MRLREIASGLQFPEGPIALADGSVLLVEIARGTLSRVTPDGRIHVVADLGGGPNGAAIGPDGAVYVCNNGGFRCATMSDGCFIPVGQADDYSGGRIERVDLATEDRPFKRPLCLATRSTGPSVEALIVVFVVAGGRPSADDGAQHAHQRAGLWVHPRDLAPLPRS